MVRNANCPTDQQDFGCFHQPIFSPEKVLRSGGKVKTMFGRCPRPLSPLQEKAQNTQVFLTNQLKIFSTNQPPTQNFGIRLTKEGWFWRVYFVVSSAARSTWPFDFWAGQSSLRVWQGSQVHWARVSTQGWCSTTSPVSEKIRYQR